MKPSLTPPPRLVLAPSQLTACVLMPNRDGSFRAVPEQAARKVLVSEAAHLAGCSTATIYRLHSTGFITGERATPRKILIDLESLRSYLEAARDPDFWTAERCRQYSSARHAA